MTLSPSAFEKLGVFYLGRLRDAAAGGGAPGAPLLYDSRDLTTHAMCVGMTGSGKTGLCVALIEEAAIDGIPALIIDPKGDLANLMLTFPNLDPADFRPWVNEDDARRKGITLGDLAAREAAKWRTGLAEWGQDGERVRRLKSSAEAAVYTPASTAGIPVSIAGSFDAPPPAIVADAELLNDRVQTAVASLLGLLGIEADQGREAALLGAILADAWQAGRRLDFAALIERIQRPPFARVGALEVETFYPANDRFALVLALNNLIASPGFSAWMTGVPLDIQSLLYTADGRPRLAIFSIAHLGDSERMFFVSLLLNQTLSWMRTRSGTSSLRALLYMDEVYGYFPPVANPPSKKPLMLLLKQARAFGLGVVLATQNPADLDYKGLANIGTWFIGKLQTERDKARLIDGLEGSGAGADRASMDRLLGALGNRVFLMRNVHDDAPVLFESRWALSYLCGPLGRDQLRRLTDESGRPAAAAAEPVRSREAGTEAAPGASAPQLDPKIRQVFVRAEAPGATLAPALIAVAVVRHTDTKLGLDESTERVFAAPLRDDVLGIDWAAAAPLDISPDQLSNDAPAGAGRAPLPAAATQVSSYARWQREFAQWIASSQKIELLRSPSTGLVSRPNEPEAAFRLRVQQALRERRDDDLARLRQKYEARLAPLADRIARAEAAVEREKAQANEARLQTALSFGSTILGAFLGRKKLSATNLSRAASTARGVGRAMRQGEDIARAAESAESLRARRAAIESELQDEIAEFESRADGLGERLEALEVAPRKSAISVRLFALGWVPANLLTST